MASRHRKRHSLVLKACCDEALQPTREARVLPSTSIPSPPIGRIRPVANLMTALLRLNSGRPAPAGLSEDNSVFN
jgi:hypothetical protein